MSNLDTILIIPDDDARGRSDSFSGVQGPIFSEEIRFKFTNWMT